MTVKEQYDFWCTNSYFDEATKAELLSIKDDEKEINERFYKDLEFGTGGLRGIIGAGTNRMNIYTVRKATQGLATTSLSRAHRTRVLQSLTIHVSCPLNLPMKQLFA